MFWQPSGPDPEGAGKGYGRAKEKFHQPRGDLAEKALRKMLWARRAPHCRGGPGQGSQVGNLAGAEMVSWARCPVAWP